MSKIQIPGHVREIIERSTIEGNILRLPEGQLDRAVYEQVNKVLAKAGGKWTKAVKGHVFPSSPKEVLGLALETGEIEDTKKELQQFHTPPEIAEEVVCLAEIEPHMQVLEPSAGYGALAVPAARRGAYVTAYDIDDDAYLALLRTPDLYIVENRDFLQVPVPEAGARFERVVMNPPFSKDRDLKHVLHAWEFVAPGGILVAITGPGWRWKETQRHREFKAFVERFGQVEIEYGEGEFRESGTNIRTVVIKLRKP